ncbi:hypothetical protein [Pseudomonas sp. LS-2]|nr:hypothetical protein [Pseudomonas sp. LS-2]
MPLLFMWPAITPSFNPVPMGQATSGSRLLAIFISALQPDSC